MSEKETKPSLESTLKSMDTEEFIDIHFYRPIGYRWALLFRRLGISPNSVTIASIFIGIASGICFYPEYMYIREKFCWILNIESDGRANYIPFAEQFHDRID